MSKDQSLRVLMVDDDREDAFLMRRALSKLAEPVRFDHVLDSTTFVADISGSAAPTDAPADIVLLDINMPRTNGFEVLRSLRENTSFNRCHVIMLTTSESDEDKEKALSLGANRFMTKPSTTAALQRFAESLLAAH